MQRSTANITSQNAAALVVRRQQDDELDQLGQHVERLGGLGREIHGELESQSRMLDELDEEVETTHHRCAARHRISALPLYLLWQRNNVHALAQPWLE